MISTVQNLIDKLVGDAAAEHMEIAAVLLDCLKILYEYIPAEDDEAKMVITNHFAYDKTQKNTTSISIYSSSRMIVWNVPSPVLQLAH